MKIIKRDGSEATYNQTKIITAINKAIQAGKEQPELTQEQVNNIATNITKQCRKLKRAIDVEDIQELVETQLAQANAPETTKRYIRYRYQANLKRNGAPTDNEILALVNGVNEEAKQENANKDPEISAVQRDYIAGIVSRDMTRRLLLDPDIVKAHDAGIIHFHDSDYFVQKIINCSLINLEDMLQNDTVISGTKIEKPKSFSTACNIATQIIAQVASSQYGGQSISLTHLAPFVDISRQKYLKEEKENRNELGLNITDEQINQIVHNRLKKEIERGVQTIQYQIITLMTTNGQAPFVTVFMYLNETNNQQEKQDLALIIEEVLKQRIKGVQNEQGIWITPAFPKLIYVLEEDNITPNSKYWYLTQLAAKCTAKRLVPDYISEKKMIELTPDKNGQGHCYPVMGCRSKLTPYVDENNQPKYYGRFNQGVVTINLPDIALTAVETYKDPNKFWEIFDNRLQLCHKALRTRHEHLKGTLSDSAPILWQHGALARLKPGETIDKLLYGGYSTISLGYAGLWECVYELSGYKLTQPEGEKLGKQILQHLNDACAKWKAEENIDYSVYGTPLESCTYKFAKALQKRFGIIEHVTDKNYITNSYHIHVTEPIDIFHKLELESEFQKLSPGGAISYGETPNMQNNIQAVLTVLQYMYDHILYAELNTKSDYCQECGYSGEIQIIEDECKLVWECPSCGNRDEHKMNRARRVCGYIGGESGFNQGRTQEIKERVLHL